MNKMKLMLKTIFISLCLLLSSAVNAQDRYGETVYLKNGSVIKGAIIEETGELLKIETPDGSVYTIGSYDIERVIGNNRNARNSQSQSPAQRTRRAEERTQRPAQRETYTQRPQRRTLNDRYGDARYNVYDNDDVADYGYYEDRSTRHGLYKGFIDFGYSLGIGEDDNVFGNADEYSAEFGRFEFSTSHGLVFDRHYDYIPTVFLGVGMGGQIYSDEDVLLYLFPFFLHTKIHFIDSRVTPFVDFKLGYSWGSISSWDELLEDSGSNISISGLYVAPSVGVRFATGSKSGINLSLGYTNQKISEISLSSGSYKASINNININMPAISLKLGFDF
jgi:hypothetical protein